jgi:hypothetical protein
MKLLTIFITICLTIIGGILIAPLFIFLVYYKKWNWKEIVRMYKLFLDIK